MTITIKTGNQELFDNLLWLLENFKDDVELTIDKSKKVEKKLPKGFTKPIEVNNYDFIVSREKIHKR